MYDGVLIFLPDFVKRGQLLGLRSLQRVHTNKNQCFKYLYCTNVRFRVQLTTVSAARPATVPIARDVANLVCWGEGDLAPGLCCPAKERRLLEL